jgi:hypothetical protein
VPTGPGAAFWVGVWPLGALAGALAAGAEFVPVVALEAGVVDGSTIGVVAAPRAVPAGSFACCPASDVAFASFAAVASAASAFDEGGLTMTAAAAGLVFAPAIAAAPFFRAGIAVGLAVVVAPGVVFVCGAVLFAVAEGFCVVCAPSVLAPPSRFGAAAVD